MAITYHSGRRIQGTSSDVTAPQGYASGNNGSGLNSRAGGGGAGSAGTGNTNNDGGAGGSGASSSITGSAVLRGGGGGGAAYGGTAGAAGSGGGGVGGSNGVAGGAGGANTGGGGGGGGGASDHAVLEQEVIELPQVSELPHKLIILQSVLEVLLEQLPMEVVLLVEILLSQQLLQ